MKRFKAAYERAHRKNPNEVTRKAKEGDGGDKIVLKEVNKGVWGMPRLSEAKKDVISCDKLRGSANRNYIRRFPNGATLPTEGREFTVR